MEIMKKYGLLEEDEESQLHINQKEIEDQMEEMEGDELKRFLEEKKSQLIAWKFLFR